MVLRCESCGADNPATNRFCGQCGRILEQTASHNPEEFWRSADGKHPMQPNAAAANLPPEVIDFDNQIPIIAGNGTDRLHPVPGLEEQFHDHLEREAELHDAHHGSEAHSEVRAKQEAERESQVRGDYLRWDTNDSTNDDANNANTSEVRATHDQQRSNAVAHANVDPAAKPVAHNFLAEGERTSGTGVSGPSFLGLTDDPAPEYDDEEPEPESHLRRNLALAIVAAAMILAIVQWRSIRDYGLTYVQNGSMQVTPSAKGAAPQNPPAIAADHSSHDPVLPFATAKTGTPLAVEVSPNADRALPVQQAASSPAPKAVDSPAAPNTKQPSAISNPVADAPPSEPPARVTKPHPFTIPAAPRVSRAAPTLGVDEMKRAASASDAEVRAVWLWKALGKGNPQAPIELAKMYEQGRGVARSCDQAQVLLRSAAAKGNFQAKLDLQQLRGRGGCSGR